MRMDAAEMLFEYETIIAVLQSQREHLVRQIGYVIAGQRQSSHDMGFAARHNLDPDAQSSDATLVDPFAFRENLQQRGISDLESESSSSQEVTLWTKCVSSAANC